MYVILLNKKKKPPRTSFCEPIERISGRRRRVFRRFFRSLMWTILPFAHGRAGGNKAFDRFGGRPTFEPRAFVYTRLCPVLYVYCMRAVVRLEHRAVLCRKEYKKKKTYKTVLRIHTRAAGIYDTNPKRRKNVRVKKRRREFGGDSGGRRVPSRTYHAQ